MRRKLGFWPCWHCRYHAHLQGVRILDTLAETVAAVLAHQRAVPT